MIDWDGHQYDHIEKLDLENGIISFSNSVGGGYFTKLPISSPDYRKENPTKYNLIYKSKKNVTVFEITDDWGTFHILKIDETPENMPFIEKNRILCTEGGS